MCLSFNATLHCQWSHFGHVRCSSEIHFLSMITEIFSSPGVKWKISVYGRVYREQFSLRKKDDSTHHVSPISCCFHSTAVYFTAATATAPIIAAVIVAGMGRMRLVMLMTVVGIVDVVVITVFAAHRIIHIHFGLQTLFNLFPSRQ